MSNIAWQDIKPNSLILTVTRRLAAYLQNEYDQYQLNQNQQAWPSLEVMPINTWLMQQWLKQSDDRILLNDHQEQVLWEQIIQDSPQSELLLRPSIIAKTAHEAWSLLQQWQIPLQSLKDSQCSDVIAFYHWAKRFNEICTENHWLDKHQLANIISGSDASFSLPAEIFFVGFDEFSPQLKQLISRLEQHCKMHYLTNIKTPLHQYRIGLADKKQEIETMARWAKQLWLSQPQITIGCIVPNLTDVRAELVNTFKNIFHEHTDSALPFNISAGEYLAQFPIIHTALLLLKLGYQTVNYSELSGLLRSPFLAGAKQEFLERAQLDANLRDLGERKISLRTILTLAKQQPNFCVILITHIEKYLLTLKKLNTARPPSAWAQFFLQQLQLLGWPGDRTLNSEEYQSVQRFQNLLIEFCTLDLVIPSINFSSALQHLAALTNNTIFQIKSESARIQIMGILEAGGITFDHLWLLGLNDEDWPATPRPNPFIPQTLQRRYNFPHSSAQRELEFSQLITQRCLQSADNIIVSYPLQDADRSLRPTPLISTLTETSITKLILADYISKAEQIYQTRALETFIDEQAPTVSTQEIVRGGSSIFKTQAACPFQAFARLRLQAESLSEPQSGFTDIERGNIVHDALARIWQNIGSYQNLCNFDDNELIKLINEVTHDVLRKLIPEKPLTLKKYFTLIEQRRLQKLLLRWLTYEKQRQPFTIHKTEYRYESKIHDIPLHLQIDRIDELADGKQIIIDYKTGKTSIQSWFDERPDEPQLPLYCLTNDKSIDGIAFAQVRSSDMKFNAIASADVLPNTTVIMDWPALQQQWNDALKNLAHEFKSGYASVKPKNLDKTCQHCGFQELCRVHER